MMSESQFYNVNADGTGHRCVVLLNDDLGPDDSADYPYALTRLSHEAIEHQVVYWMYSDGKRLRMSDEFRTDYIAKAWPGGRLESKRGIRFNPDTDRYEAAINGKVQP